MRANVYAHGNRIGRDDSMPEIAINTLWITFDSVNDPELKARIMTGSHLNGEEINHIPSCYASTWPEILDSTHKKANIKCRFFR